MTFYFRCPEGHVLQGELPQVGTHCLCPVCGLRMIVPSPTAVGHLPNETPPIIHSAEPEVGFDLRVEEDAEPELLHIPCPNGHELETPREMLDQFAMCPQCRAKFRLRRRNSVEFRRQQDEQEAQRLRKMGRVWMKWAVTILVLVVLAISLLTAFSMN